MKKLADLVCIVVVLGFVAFTAITFRAWYHQPANDATEIRVIPHDARYDYERAMY